MTTYDNVKQAYYFVIEMQVYVRYVKVMQRSSACGTTQLGIHIVEKSNGHSKYLFVQYTDEYQQQK